MSMLRFGYPSLDCDEWLKLHPTMHNDFPQLAILYAWRNVWNPVVNPGQMDDRTLTLEGTVQCKCGTSTPCVLLFPGLLSLDPFDFCRFYERESRMCHCSYVAELSYMDDCVNPYLVPFVSKVVARWTVEGKDFKVYERGISQADKEAAMCPIKLSKTAMQFLRDFSCFDADDVLNEALAVVTGADVALPNLDKMMLSHVDPYVVGVAPERALFQAGASYVRDPYFLDARMLQERAGFPVVKSNYRIIEQVAIGMCCALENKQLDYMIKIFGHENETCQKDLQAIIENFVIDHLTSFPSEKLSKYAKSKVYFPRMHQLRGQVESNILNTVPHNHVWVPGADEKDNVYVSFSHGVYGNSLRGSLKELGPMKDFYAKQSGVFPSAYSSLNKCRVARKASVVLDTVFKPCSSIETWTYGNRYSTIAKWKWALKDEIFKGGGNMLAAGCGEHNWWHGACKRLTRKFGVAVDFVDINTFGRKEVRVMDVNDVKPGEYDYIVSDVQVVLDWERIFEGARKAVVVKLLPSMHKSFSAMSDAMIANTFELVGVYACGRLHNGEQIAVFKKLAPIADGKLREYNKNKRDKVSSVDIRVNAAKKLVVDGLHRDVRAILGLMAGHMAIGEERRKKHLRLLVLGVESVCEPDLDMMERHTDYKIVAMLKPIHRKMGGVARWVLEQSNPYPQFETEGVSRVSIHGGKGGGAVKGFSQASGIRTDRVVSMATDVLGKHPRNRPAVVYKGVGPKLAQKLQGEARARGDTVIPRSRHRAKK